MVRTSRAAFAALLSILFASTAAVAEPQPGGHVAVEQRFVTAWTDLNGALWMLTHTDAVNANGADYKRATQSLYQAIGALDDGIMSSTRHAPEPHNGSNGRARLHAALNFLLDAERNLQAPSRDRNADPHRASALLGARSAIAATQSLLAECHC